MKLRWIAWIAVAVSFAGCDSGIEYSAVPREFASTFCGALEECGGATVSLFFFQGADCTERAQATLENQTVPAWDAAIAAGTIVYDGAAAATCFDETRALGCDVTVSPTPAACREIFAGTIDIGQPCSLDEECVGDAYCASASCPDSAGTCTARAADGGACEGDEECTAGLTCDDGRCGPPASRRNGPCGGGSGLECPIDQSCVGEDDETMTQGTCMDRASLQTAAAGETCEIEGMVQCQEGLSCAVIGADMTGATFECRDPVGAGGACFLGFPSMCPTDQYCDATPAMGSFEGTCQPLPGDGEACLDATGFSARCRPGLACVGGTTCRAPQPNGASCTGNTECLSSNCVDGTCSADELCAI